MLPPEAGMRATWWMGCLSACLSDYRAVTDLPDEAPPVAGVAITSGGGRVLSDLHVGEIYAGSPEASGRGESENYRVTLGIGAAVAR
jgi:hypothetical protein